MTDITSVSDTSLQAVTVSGNHGTPGVWYDDDTVIPYLMTFRSKQARPLNRAELARFAAGPVIR